MSPDALYLTAVEAADRLGCTPPTVRRWVREVRLPGARLPGGHYRIDQRDLVLVLRPGADVPRGGPVGPAAA